MICHIIIIILFKYSEKRKADGDLVRIENKKVREDAARVKQHEMFTAGEDPVKKITANTLIYDNLNYV